MSPRPSLAAATAELSSRDPDLARLVRQADAMRWRARQGDHYQALVRAIVFQQLAGRAAASIHARFVSLFDGAEPTAETVLALPDESLRSAGLSTAKARSIQDLSAHVVDGRVDLDHISRLTDDEVVAQLSTVRGIGRWTAEMFLLFQLRRLDVWPTGDLGVRNGYGLIHHLPEPPTPTALEVLGEIYVPYRSVAALWCWEAVHLAAAAKASARTPR